MQGSLRMETKRETHESSSFANSDGPAAQSINERLEFSAHIASVEGSRVLDEEADLLESIDAP